MAQGLLNKDVFVTDPTNLSIPNLGVAKVTEPRSAEELATLDYELRSFVCEGEYERGLDVVLSTFLANLGHPQQPAVWVSGFYGSGKSHFVRVLEFLWRDMVFPDGARARAKADLPDHVRAHLQELSVAGRRAGGLWSAAGTLGASAGDSTVRLGMLGIVFRSAGLPSQYGRARFVLWLKQSGVYEALKAGVEAAGRDFGHELENLYVSPPLHQALLDALPDFAPSRPEVGKSLREQFPSAPSDVGDDDLVESLDAVLRLKVAEAGFPGKRPLTLIVFDELQQFIGDDSTRTLQVQQVVEACSARFGSSLLFLGTGQAQLQGTPQLQKLQGRFTVRVMLSDADVERVVREVVLRKDQTKVGALEQTLERASGEISRHLTETRIGPNGGDRDALVPDYPLLPTRRRFWERVLRAVDTSALGGQLRTQLRIVQEANRSVAQRPLGHVVGGDVIFAQLKGDMLQSGVLLREIDEFIAGLDDGTADGKLAARLCATAFLIQELPTTGSAVTGLRATAENLADLLVEDLTGGDAELRGRVPRLLDGLVEEGRLMRVEGEYRLQTREGMQWEQEFRERTQRIVNDDARIADERTRLIRAAVEAELKGLRLTHGQSKTPREIELHYGLEAPAATGGKVPVWVRDEWSVTERAVREEAQAAGTEGAVVSVFLPRREAEALKGAVARAAAAEETLNAKGQPSSDEGRQALAAMRSRAELERDRRDDLIGHVVHAAKVYQGGGSEVAEGAVRASVQAAVEASLARLFPRFALGDHPNWDRVAKRATEGSGDALAAIGYGGDAADEPACREARRFVGAGKKGGEVRDRFKAPPYGWPQDTIDGALLALTGAGLLRAARNGLPQPMKALTKQQIPQTDFAGEEIPVTKLQLINLRGLVGELGSPVKSDDEMRAALPLVLTGLVELAARAGGAAPLPPPPSTAHLAELQALSGNAQLVAVLEAKERLLADRKGWQAAAAKAGARLPRWRALQRLVQHGGGLAAVEEARPQIDAIAANGALLDEPDPVTHLYAEVTAALRGGLREARQRVVEAREREIDHLKGTPEWTQLADDQWQEILAAEGLGPTPEVEIGSDEQLLATLDAGPLSDWEERVLALPQRLANAREVAAKRLAPKAVKVRPPAATLRSAVEVDAYLDELRRTMMRHIGDGVPVIV